MKNVISLVTLLLVFCFVLGGANAVYASANSVSNTSINCTMTVLSSAQLTSTANISSTLQWRTRINVTNKGNEAIVCNGTYESYTYVGLNYTLINSTSQNVTVISYTNANSRYVFNFTKTVQPLNYSEILNLTFNFTTGITSQGSLPQRLLGQIRRTITNNGEVDLTNVWSNDVSYDSSWADAVNVYECTATICGDTVGSASSKTAITGASLGQQNSTNVIKWKDATLTASSTTTYAIEGDMTPTGYDEDYDAMDNQVVGTQGTQAMSITHTPNAGSDKTLMLIAILVFVWALVCIVLYYKYE